MQAMARPFYAQFIAARIESLSGVLRAWMLIFCWQKCN